MASIEVEVWIIVDSCGDYAIAKDNDYLVEAYEDAIQPIADANGTRRVRVTLSVPLPEVVELTGTVTADDDQQALVSAR